MKLPDHVSGRISSEIEVFAQAASLYFGKYNELHQSSEALKKHGSLGDLLANTGKAHKAAWKHVLENSQTHKDGELHARKVLPKAAFDQLHDWLNEKEASK